MSLTNENPYTEMQREFYETTAHEMQETNHAVHNANPDYWAILVNDTATGYGDKNGLDFGCGCGRNVQNLWARFGRMDGVDISANNVEFANQNMQSMGVPEERYHYYQCSGVNLDVLPDNEYDFIMSTIVLQHICVHEIRNSYFREFFRVARPGALLSFQMGFGEGWGKAGYYDNHYDALATNSKHDTMVTDPAQLQGDIEAAGFENFSFQIRPAFDDGHPAWIFVKANKPAE